MSNSGITEIAYHFADASVPPDYHRSYSITVTAAAVRIVVDSYGEILADETFAVTAERFDELRGSLSRRRIWPMACTTRRFPAAVVSSSSISSGRPSSSASRIPS